MRGPGFEFAELRDIYNYKIHKKKKNLIKLDFIKKTKKEIHLKYN